MTTQPNTDDADRADFEKWWGENRLRAAQLANYD
jgi:hypothetical protein